MRHAPLLLAFVLSLVAPTLAAEENASKENAADLYREAFEQMKLTEAEYDRLSEAVKADEPLPADVKRLLQENAPAVELALKAAKAEAVDWGLDTADGPEAEVPWFTPSVNLAYVLAGAARNAAEAGDGDAAARLVAANLALAHDFGSSPMMLGELVETGYVSLTVVSGTHVIGQLDNRSLEELRRLLEQTRERMSLSEAIRAEGRITADWLQRHDQFPVDHFDDFWPGTFREIERQWADVATRREWTDGLAAAYAEAADALMLPADERLEAVRKAEEDRTKHGPLAQHLATGFQTTAKARERSDIEFALLRAAIAYRLDGEAGLKTVPDPGDDGAFQLEKTADGFTLTSAKMVRGEPVSLTVRVSE